MIFSYTWEKVLSGEKTVTRRLVKPGETAWGPSIYYSIEEVHTKNDHTKWIVGNTYAVQPGRGKPAIWYDERGADTPPDMLTRYMGHCGKGDRKKAIYFLKADRYVEARIRLLSIRRECVQDISEEDAIAEGIKYDAHFCFICNGTGEICGDHASGWGCDPCAVCNGSGWKRDPVMSYKSLWDSINKRPGTRWADNPDVWCLTFELVRE